MNNKDIAEISLSAISHLGKHCFATCRNSLPKRFFKHKSKQSNMERITGAEALLRSLENEGVDVLFGYPGGSIMPTYDVLYDHKETLNHILVRHEQGAVHAAQGYARVS